MSFKIAQQINKKSSKEKARETPVKERGFAILYTVLVVTLILNMAISISSVTYKQGVLSSLANDSQTAFYQADFGAECLLYNDITLRTFPLDALPSDPRIPNSIVCGGQTITKDSTNSLTNYIIYNNNSVGQSTPCFSASIDKRTPPTTIVQSRGLNLCQSTPRQVERAVDVRY